MECNNCKSILENNAKFCTNCGGEISVENMDSTDKKDISWYFLLLTIPIGLIPAIFEMRMRYDLNHIPFFNFMGSLLDHAVPETYGELIGYSLGMMIIPAIIIGFIFGIRSLMSKAYKKPILHIFIGTLISIVMMSIKNAG